MTISKTMLIQWLTLIVAVLTLPSFAQMVPPGTIPYVAAAAGALTLIARWVDQNFGAIGLMAVATLLSGLLSIPDLVAIIPPQAAQIVTLVTAVLSLVTRANQSTTPLVGLLVKPAGSAEAVPVPLSTAPSNVIVTQKKGW